MKQETRRSHPVQLDTSNVDFPQTSVWQEKKWGVVAGHHVGKSSCIIPWRSEGRSMFFASTRSRSRMLRSRSTCRTERSCCGREHHIRMTRSSTIIIGSARDARCIEHGIASRPAVPFMVLAGCRIEFFRDPRCISL